MRLLLLFILLTQAFACAEAPPQRLKELRRIALKIQPLMQKKLAPQAGEWMNVYKETGQTFDQYLAANPNRPGNTRTKLYLQPFGKFTAHQQRLAQLTAELLGIHYGLQVKLLPTRDLSDTPANARRTLHPGDTGTEQLLTTYILDNVMIPLCPKDAVAVLGLTTSDLWPGEGWNFVFGQADLEERVGIWSIARFGDAEKNWSTVLRRTLKVALHETGHMFGIQHCTANECGMNGSNSLGESDRCPLPFCNECDLKLWWACNLDPALRAKTLLQFFERNQLTREAEEIRRVLQSLDE